MCWGVLNRGEEAQENQEGGNWTRSVYRTARDRIDILMLPAQISSPHWHGFVIRLWERATVGDGIHYVKCFIHAHTQ